MVGIHKYLIHTFDQTFVNSNSQQQRSYAFTCRPNVMNSRALIGIEIFFDNQFIVFDTHDSAKVVWWIRLNQLNQLHDRIPIHSNRSILFLAIREWAVSVFRVSHFVHCQKRLISKTHKVNKGTLFNVIYNFCISSHVLL